MSTLAVDTPANRSNERLTMFMTEIGNEIPIDNFFQAHPAIDMLISKSQKKSGGRQIGFSTDMGDNPTVADFSDSDVFSITVPDTARWVAYPYVNKGGSVVILGEEQRETDGADHRIFEVMKHRRNNLLETIFAQYTTDLFAAAQVAGKINSLNLLIDSTGSVGGLDAATESSWASVETGSGSFATQGLADMRTLWNSLHANKANVDVILTNQTIYESYENEIDPDVRYSVPQGTGGRGFKTLEFKGQPITWDVNATTQVIYMWDSKFTYLSMDTGWNFDFEPFQDSFTQKLSASKFANRMQLVTTNRRSAGKLTGVTA